MNDRVRIYELARKMNLPNQDLIITLRELGYDIKSHSSTVDSHAVGLLIAALGKKKQQKQEKPQKSSKTPTKTAAPAVATSIPVPAKPRVLSRYRPQPVLPVEAEAASEQVSVVPALSVSELPVAHAENAGQNLAQAMGKTVVEDKAAIEQISEVSKTTAITSRASKERLVDVEMEPTLNVVEDSALTKQASVETENELLTPSPKKVEVREEETVHFDSSFAVPTVRPTMPSVPIRIAAPSFRATPPRPPKTHRALPTERHVAKKEEKSSKATVAVEVPKVIGLTNSLTVHELAEKMATSESEIIKRLFVKGYMRTVNQLVELDLARDLALEMGYEIASPEELAAAEREKVPELEELSDEDRAALVPRPPVVTIMGHVDHGKTSLLDAIRQTKFLLTDAEAGGITQHIGAYHVEVTGEDGAPRQIVFLDTPGHEAFTAMRARGAKVTDIAVLVVAADDGVMPQTIEAIDHAKAAGVPIIVAVNKIDKADADPSRVLGQLMEHDLVAEELGGDTVIVSVSAKKRIGLDQLLSMILLVADLEDYRANPDRPASGTIIEAELSRGRGSVATALVQNGTLREGDFVVAGSTSGRVRALFDDRGQRVKAAGPSMPVEVLGLTEVPQAGDKFEAVEDIQSAKLLSEQRKQQESDRRGHRVTLESLHDLMEQGEVRELNIIVKADVQGTAEAIADQVKRLTSKEVQVRVLRTASGDISENDVNLAASSNAIIIGFNVQPDQNAAKAGEVAGVDIRTYNIIYQIVDDLELAIQGLLQPIKQELEIGVAEIRQLFKIGKNLVIAGCYILNGKISRNAFARIKRNDVVVYEGKIDTLKRFKDDVKEVAQGFECGMSFDKFNEVKEGDLVYAFIIQEIKRELTR